MTPPPGQADWVRGRSQVSKPVSCDLVGQGHCGGDLSMDHGVDQSQVMACLAPHPLRFTLIWR